MSKKKKAKSIDVEKIDLDLMKERTTDLPGLIEYAHSIGGFSIVPTEEGVIKGQAMNAMKEQTEMHMHQIYEQMQVLAKQANKLKKRAEISCEIYNAQMRFKPVIGKTYFLYEKKDQTKVLSMVAPQEWGNSLPFEKFIAKVKLLSDHTWEVLEE
ncbi:MAG: DUF2452 domain-containing protein [Bacteriovoracaceae bacterium]|jgi:hypothetical protein|nr:hypothetical protein [Halobacteriovoraceae bacterium]MDP7320622.1 DUF2452 domain-containing protein [Bacteriovoracaceae bacterium]|tara:strand:+ start:343 stop:807 length:465 start_codon:yes stop_codon:yes gene_type:complete